MSTGHQDLDAALKKILTTAWDDETFKGKLVADPHGALKEIGYELPSEIDLRVTDQSDTDKLYINIPNKERTEKSMKDHMSDMELTDEQLEDVAGGEFIVGGTLLLLGAGFTLGFAGGLAGTAASDDLW